MLAKLPPILHKEVKGVLRKFWEVERRIRDKRSRPELLSRDAEGKLLDKLEWHFASGGEFVQGKR